MRRALVLLALLLPGCAAPEARPSVDPCAWLDLRADASRPARDAPVEFVLTLENCGASPLPLAVADEPARCSGRRGFHLTLTGPQGDAWVLSPGNGTAQAAGFPFPSRGPCPPAQERPGVPPGGSRAETLRWNATVTRYECSEENATGGVVRTCTSRVEPAPAGWYAAEFAYALDDASPARSWSVRVVLERAE